MYVLLCLWVDLGTLYLLAFSLHLFADFFTDFIGIGLKWYKWLCSFFGAPRLVKFHSFDSRIIALIWRASHVCDFLKYIVKLNATCLSCLGGVCICVGGEIYTKWKCRHLYANTPYRQIITNTKQSKTRFICKYVLLGKLGKLYILL